MAKFAVPVTVSLVLLFVAGLCNGAQSNSGDRAILEKYQALGGSGGFLGSPQMQSPSSTADGVGRYQHFQGGSIFWRPCVGAYEVHGVIREKWASLGWERSSLGYPKTDEISFPGSRGRYNEFQRGIIYWHPAHNKAFVVEGQILLKWADSGFETGTFGYPIADVEHRLQVGGGGVPRPPTTPRVPTVPRPRGGTDADPLSVLGAETSEILVQRFEKGEIRVTSKAGMDLREEIKRKGLGVRDQLNPRGTCSVFAMTFLLEYTYTNYCGRYWRNTSTARERQFTDLSEEYLNYVTNVLAGNDNDGDFFHLIDAAYQKYGIVTEADLPYQATYNRAVLDRQFAQGVLSLRSALLLFNTPKLKPVFIRKNDGNSGITEAQLSRITGYIDRGIPVAVGQTEPSGRSHSMVAVAYRNSADPGGGIMTFRDSFGASYGIQGHTEKSFQEVRDQTNDAVVYLMP